VQGKCTPSIKMLVHCLALRALPTAARIARVITAWIIVTRQVSTVTGACDRDWMDQGDGCYKMVESDDQAVAGFNHVYQARQACIDAGGDIADNPADFAAVVAALAFSDKVYVGIHRINSSDWVTLAGDGADVAGLSSYDYCSTWDPLTQLTSVQCCQAAAVNKTLCYKAEDDSTPLSYPDDPFNMLCTGNTCDSVPPSLQCENGGICSYRNLEAECICDAVYVGNLCQTGICESGICEHGNQCNVTEAMDSYRCTCEAAFSGDNCEQVVDGCWNAPCHHNATCTGTDRLGNFSCECVNGTTGSTCDSDLDECEQYPTICENGGMCVNTNMSFYCTCPSEYTGHTCSDVVRCEAPEDIVNTTMTTDPESSPGGFDFGASVTYDCVAGTKFPDRTTQQNATCLANMWIPESQAGAIEPCGPHCPPHSDVENAVAVFPTKSMVNTELTYNCDTGHKFCASSDCAESMNSTHFTIECQLDQTWNKAEDDMPSCDVVHCGDLPPFANQNLDNHNDSYASEVVFWCDTGFMLQDSITEARTLYCEADEEWSADLVPCDRVSCPVVQWDGTSPGMWNDTQNMYVYDNMLGNLSYRAYDVKLMYRCENGLHWDGSNWKTTQCQDTGEWTNHVEPCASERCPGQPYVSFADSSDMSSNWHDTATYTCDTGYKFYMVDGTKVSQRSITCDPTDSNWTPLLEACRPIECPILNDVLTSNGIENIIRSTDVIGTYLYSKVVELTCLKGHYYDTDNLNTTSHSVECLVSEEWNDTIDSTHDCHPVPCPTHPDINITTGYANNTKDDYVYADIVTYTCLQTETEIYKFLDGYKVRSIQCNEVGDWNTTDITCRKDRCDPIPLPDNTVADTVDTLWNTVVNYTCLEGYEWENTREAKHSTECNPLGPSAWTVLLAGLDTCKKKTCPLPPYISNAERDGPTTGTVPFRTTITYYCVPGHKFSDGTLSFEKMCQADGTYKPEIEDKDAGCQLMLCDELNGLELVENATLSSNNRNWNRTVKYTCTEGYQFPDKDTVKEVSCGTADNASTDATWTWFSFKESLDEEKRGNFCEVVFCPPVPAWYSAQFNSSENEFGVVISYFCKVNYTFDYGENELDYERNRDEEEQSSWVNGSLGLTEVKVSRTVLTSMCLEEKRWYPPVIDCLSSVSLRVIIAQESPQGEAFGTTAIAVIAVIVVLIILLDLNKLYSDIVYAKNNVKSMMDRNKKNKVGDSDQDIPRTTPLPESTC